MGVRKFLMNRIVAPLLVVLLTPVAIGVGSKIITGDYVKWFKVIHVWIVLGGAVLFWVIIAVHKRIKRLQKLRDSPSLSVVSIPVYGWITIGEIEYAGVKWMIRAPAPPPFSLSYRGKNISPSDLKVEIPPRCPNCKTELEESPNFWGGYLWKCVRCGFQKKNKESYYKVVRYVEKIARREWEERE